MKLIERIVKCLISAITNVFHIRNLLVMEMEAGREDNTEAILVKLLNEGWNEKHKIVVISEAPENIS